MMNDLLAAIEQSDPATSRKMLEKILQGQTEPWVIHEALFPVVQTVLNPPFINPHLSKMYAIHREFLHYLKPDDLAPLLRLEVEEYARREKLPAVAKPTAIPSKVSFDDIEKAISKKDVAGTAAKMEVFLNTAGQQQFAKKMLLLGSAYLNQSLGHSVSCTAFILLEMIEQKQQESWPALALLAHYFCKGGFQQTPELQSTALKAYGEAYLFELQRAVSESGIVALHHTITLYSIERSRHFFEAEEYDHMLTMWSYMMKYKKENLHPLEKFTAESIPDYSRFFTIFSQNDPVQVANLALSGLADDKERIKLARYLIKGVLQQYNGKYNPHSLTGLGSALWVMEKFSGHQAVVINALLQYLEFLYSDIS